MKFGLKLHQNINYHAQNTFCCATILLLVSWEFAYTDHTEYVKLQVAMQNLWFNKDIKEAIDAPRFHHQLFPMRLQYEYGVLQVRASKVSCLPIINLTLSSTM